MWRDQEPDTDGGRAVRARRATVDTVLGSSVEVRTRASVPRLVGEDGVEEVEITDLQTEES